MSTLKRRMMMKAKEQQPSVEDLDYFTVVPESREGVTIHFRRPVIYYYDTYNDVHIHYNAPYYYRMNEGSWVKVESVVTEVEGIVTEDVLIEHDSLFIPYGSKMQIKCDLVEYAGSIGVYHGYYPPEIKNDEGEGMFSVEGTPMSLIYGEPQREFKELLSGTMFRFKECFGLTRINNPKSFLPGTVLVDSCYNQMFYNCPNLVNSPELPATTLAYSCYAHMFEGCTSLVNAPELPATKLAVSCYYSMFEGCINLNYIKMLATDISATSCLSNWVLNVASTGTFVKSKDATWDAVGDSGVPQGWTVITDDQLVNGKVVNPISVRYGNYSSFVKQYPVYVESVYPVSSVLYVAFDVTSVDGELGLATRQISIGDTSQSAVYTKTTPITNIVYGPKEDACFIYDFPEANEDVTLSIFDILLGETEYSRYYERGMTWREYCGSRYNNLGCYIHDDVLYYNIYVIEDANGNFVSPDDLIVENGNYYAVE